MIAGVAGGVARRLGVDPLIVRILLVVLAFFGGVGILLYGLGWLLLPDDDGRSRSLLEDATTGRSAKRTRNLVLVAALVAGILISGGWVLSGQVIPVLLLGLAVAALYLYARRENVDPAWPGPYVGAPAGTAQYASRPTAYDPAPSYQPGRTNEPAPAADRAAAGAGLRPGGSHQYVPPADVPPTDYPDAAYLSAQYPPAPYPPAPYQPAPYSSAPYSPAPYSPAQYRPADGPPGEYRPTDTLTADTLTADYPPSGLSTGGLATRSPGGTAYGPAGPMSTPPRPRERSYLGLLTISVALVALGVVAALDAGGATVPGTAYVGIALGVVALGLLIGTWFGRSRGLILLGFLLCVVMVPAAVADTATDGDWSRMGEWNNAQTVRETPTQVDDIRPAYDVDSGQLVLDLRRVDFTGSDIRTSLTIGAGEITVLVPADVDVTAAGAMDMGRVTLFGNESAGVDVQSRRTDLGADGEGGGQLDLTIEANIGDAEVRREAA